MNVPCQLHQSLFTCFSFLAIMEVDLTDDDLIMTTPIQLGVPKPSTATAKPQKKTSAPVDILVISDDDDDDIIFEPEVSSKETANLPRSGSSTSISKLSSDAAKPSKRSSKDDKMEVDDIIEVVDKASPAPSKGKLPPTTSNVEKDKPSTSSSVPNLNSSASKKQSTNLTKGNTTNVPSGQHKGTNDKSDPKVAEIIELPGSPPQTSEESLLVNKERAKDSTVQAKPSKSASACRYVVDITDEEKSRTCYPKRNSENTCLNVSCSSGDDLKLAPMFVVSYYGCKLKRGKYDVCADCFEAAVNHHSVCLRIEIMFALCPL